MGLSKKLADAKSSDWLCQGIADEEVVKIISEAKEKAREQIKLIDTLDKIRAEIEALEEGITSYHNDRPWIFKDEVLQIIDKYKVESEE